MEVDAVLFRRARDERMPGRDDVDLWPRAATDAAIGSMKVPTLSPGNRGYDVVTITTTSAMSAGRAAEHQPPRDDQRLERGPASTP